MFFSKTKIPPTYYLIDNPKKLAWLLQELLQSSEFSFDIETNYPTWKNKKRLPSDFTECICGISFSWGRTHVESPWMPGLAGYVPITNSDDSPYWGDRQSYVVGALREVLESDISKVAQNGKFDVYKLMFLSDVQTRALAFDTMLAHAILDEDRRQCSHALKSDFGLEGQVLKLGMSDRYLSSEGSFFKDDLNEALNFYDQQLRRYSKVPLNKLYPYGCADADLTLSLKYVFEPMLAEQGMLQLFNEVVMPLQHVLTVMELHGVPLDIPVAQRVREEHGSLMREAEKLIYELAAKSDPSSEKESRTLRFNVGSPQQLGKILFSPIKEGGMGLSGKRNQLGKWITDGDVIKELDHPISEPILKFRRAEQIHGHYADAALNKVVEVTNEGQIGWVHPQYWMDSVTGRLKCTEPNLTTLPKPENGGMIVKGMWRADDDHLFVFSDFSQIELRVIAHISGEPVWVDGFRAGHDMHSAMAKRIWNLDCPVEEVKKKYGKERSDAKTVNFGIAYGESEYSLSQQLGMTVEDAYKLINEDYFGAAPVLRRWIDEVHETLKQFGSVQNLFGRIRHLPDAMIHVPDGVPWPDKQVRPKCYRQGPYPAALDIDPSDLYLVTERHLCDQIRMKQKKHLYHCLDCPHIQSCFINREVKYTGGLVARALRQGVNAPIQGSAVDMTSLALTWIHQDFLKYEIPACPILHIHDELMVYARKDVIPQVIHIMEHNMIKRLGDRLQFKVPILTDTKVVQRWSDKHDDEE